MVDELGSEEYKQFPGGLDQKGKLVSEFDISPEDIFFKTGGQSASDEALLRRREELRSQLFGSIDPRKENVGHKLAVYETEDGGYIGVLTSAWSGGSGEWVSGATAAFRNVNITKEELETLRASRETPQE